jgi:hypothetical protein
MKDKIMSGFRAALSGSVALFTYSMFAQTWQTIDDFQYAPGQEAEADGLDVAPNGTLFACGDATDALEISHGLVMASADGGITWSAPLDDFVPSGDANLWYYAGIAVDRAGNVYVAGNTEPNSGSGPSHWIVRRSLDGGATWSTVDDYQDGGVFTSAHGITSDSAGNIYVAGYSDATSAWTIRKGVGGTNFTTVDRVPSSWLEGANAIYVHPTAGIFAAGVGPVATSTDKRGDVTTYYGWLVRRSTNGGATWSTVDTFSLSSGYKAVGGGMGSDGFGNVYVVGYGYATAGKGANAAASSHWVVRKSTNGGSSWSIVDNFQLSSGADNQANSFVADSQGNLYVAGYGNTSTGLHWMVRKNPGGTGTWSTDDDFRYMSAYDAWPFAMAANASGNVFVGGIAYSGSNTHWLVRKR